MKNLIALLVTMIIFWSCTPDDRQEVALKILPVESYVLPDSLEIGTTQIFTIRYKRPSNCHFFEGFYYQKSLNQRTIGITTSVLQENCQTLAGAPLEVDLKFYTTNNGSYIFRFYKGKDAAGGNIFESVTVPVKD